MAKVLGVGGVFFKVQAPQATMAWYERVLGVEPGEYGGADFLHKATAEAFPAGARTVFSPFGAETDYFAPSDQGFMINLIVDDLDAMMDRIKAEGVALEGKPESYDYGKFAWVMDPNGIKVELWEPAKG